MAPVADHLVETEEPRVIVSVLVNKLFQPSDAFLHPVTLGVLIGVGVLFVLTPVIVALLWRAGRLDEAMRREIGTRYRSWLIIVPAIVVPLLLGPGSTILAVCVLSLLCYREFARATGVFRHRSISVVVVLGILATTFASYDHWYHFFVALPSLTIILITVIALARDEPHGYIQRVALGVLSYLLFGVCLGHMGYFANDAQFRPMILLIVLCVEANDIFAYVVGKLAGRTRVAPVTSPKKTFEGCLGAMVLTTALFALLGRWVFGGTMLESPLHLIVMGILLSVVGQFGDLVISSIKRDLGIKDMGVLIPGHGGILDRFDSLILVAPAMFHYIGYFIGIGGDQPERIFSGGWGG